MVDVNVHKIFPTVVYEFEYISNDKQSMVSYIDTLKTNTLQTTDDLHYLSYFGKLRDKVKEVSKQYVDDLQYEYDNIEITGMWANRLHNGAVHAPHTHSNNFLSGVYYLHTSKNSSPIQFFDPRAQAHVLRPRNTPNFLNASIMQFNAVEGKGYIFPSWLQHWVPTTEDKRISVSWNILLRGNYGEQGTLQNAYI
jgi:uncharacterized protein (TIGR02466 family)